MKATALIAALQSAVAEHGDLEVALTDYNEEWAPPSRVAGLDVADARVMDEPREYRERMILLLDKKVVNRPPDEQAVFDPQRVRLYGKVPS